MEMKSYASKLKIFAVLLCILSFNLLHAEDDEFKVVVTKKPTVPTEIPPDIDPDAPQPPGTTPSFPVSEENEAQPFFDIDVIFEGDAPTDGTVFEINVSVFVKDDNCNLQAVSLLNASGESQYILGSRASIANGRVNVEVAPKFEELLNCEYYFVFDIKDITYSEEGGETDYSFQSSPGMMTKDKPGCSRSTSYTCVPVDGPEGRFSTLDNETEFKLYPNPSLNGRSTISLSNLSVSHMDVEILITDQFGKLINKLSFSLQQHSRVFEKKLNFSELPFGIYIVKVQTGNDQFIGKILHQ